MSEKKEGAKSLLKMLSLRKVAIEAKKMSMTQSALVYKDEKLDKVAVKEFLRFVPALSHHHIKARAFEAANSESSDITTHFVKDHWVAMLFLDISGFTRLAQALGAEKTKHHCNEFFSMILNVIACFKGDTLKFLGDAMFVLWTLDEDPSDEQCSNTCNVAAECAAAIMAVGNYDAKDVHAKTHEVFHVKLRLHCGLVCGPIKFYHVGNHSRAEALIGGEPIPQIAKCEAQAEQGEVIMSPEFRSRLPKSSEISKFSDTKKGDNFLLNWEKLKQKSVTESSTNGSNNVLVNSSMLGRVQSYLKTSNICVASLETQHDNFLEKNNKHKEIFRSETMNQAEVAKLKRERLRVLQHVRAEARNIRGGVAKRRKEAFVRLAIRDLTHEVARRAVHNDMVGIIGDMNRVTTIFIRLDQLIPHIASGDLGTVQRAFLILLKCLQRHGGVVRQFVQDDKGCVGIGAFGVSGHSYINNGVRAIRCAFDMVENYSRELNIDCSIGIATGDVFCGLVGSSHRCEWAMLGPSVNLAARLMGKAKPGQVLVESETHRETYCQDTNDIFKFESLDPVKAKGYDNLVQVFAPVLLISEDEDDGYYQKNIVKTEKIPSSKSQKLTRMERLLDLDMFAHLVLKIAAVITFCSEELTWGRIKSNYQPEKTRSRHKRVFSLAQIIFGLSALGHGSDLNKVHDALMTLCEEPMLIRSAPPSKAQVARSHSRVCTSHDQKAKPESHIPLHHVNTIIGALSNHFLFAEMSKNELLKIAKSMKPVKLRAGDTLFKQGDPSDVYYVLVEGNLSLFVDDMHIKTFNPGMGFGELSILFSTPRTATIRALKTGEKQAQGLENKDVFLCYLDRDDFLKHVNMEFTFADGDIRRKVYAQILSKHLNEMHSIVATFLLNQRNHRKLLRGRFQNVVKKIMNFNRWNKAALLAIAHKESSRVLPKHKISRLGSMEFSSGEESFDGGGGLQIRVCEHLMRSDMNAEVKIEHVERLAEAAVNHSDTKMIIRWTLQLLETAFGLETSGTDVVLGYLCQDEAKSPARAQEEPSYVKKSTRFSVKLLDDRSGLILHPIQPVVGYKRKKSGRKLVSSNNSMSFRMTHDEIENECDKINLRHLISIEKLSEYLLTLSETYKISEKFITSFNLAQVSLKYLGFPLTPVKREGVSFVARYIHPLRHGQSVKSAIKSHTSRRTALAKWAYDVSFASIQGRFVKISDRAEMAILEHIMDMLNSARRRFESSTLASTKEIHEDLTSEINVRIQHSRRSETEGDVGHESTYYDSDNDDAATPSGTGRIWRLFGTLKRVLNFTGR